MARRGYFSFVCAAPVVVVARKNDFTELFAVSFDGN